MRQSSAAQEKASPRARIAWRRAADELLIAAIFADGVECRDDERRARSMAPRTDERKVSPAIF